MNDLMTMIRRFLPRKPFPCGLIAGGIVALAVLVLVVILTVTNTPIPLGYPGNPVTANAQWTPVYETFNGVEMVLVPVGCFRMGSASGGNDDERPVHEICFEQPFWIDRMEVTNGQYGSEGTFGGENHPRESVNWFDARDFCASRGARLPTGGGVGIRGARAGTASCIPGETTSWRKMWHTTQIPTTGRQMWAASRVGRRGWGRWT